MPKTNGVPTVIDASTPVVSDNAALNIINPSIEILNYTNAVQRCLDEMPDLATIVIDPNRRRISATDEPSLRAELFGIAQQHPDKHNYRPDAGQSGRSLLWTMIDSSGNWSAMDQDLLTSLSEPQKQARSLSSVISALIAAMPEPGPYANIYIDQVAGKVYLFETATPAADSAAMLAVVPTVGLNNVGLQFSDPPGDGPAVPLKFEGGPV